MILRGARRSRRSRICVAVSMRTRDVAKRRDRSSWQRESTIRVLGRFQGFLEAVEDKHPHLADEAQAEQDAVRQVFMMGFGETLKW